MKLTASLACAAMLLGGNAEPKVQAAAPVADPNAHRSNGALTVTISGGASLGAYEAGYLYYIGETMRTSKMRPPLRLLAGTSAGSINSLLTILSIFGGGESRTPEQSLYWRVWLPLSIQGLFQPDQVTPVNFLSRGPLQDVAAMVEKEWKQGLSTDCDLVWAVPTTRLHPRSIGLAKGGLQLPRTEEKFVLRVRGRGLGKPPSVRNYVDKRAGFEQATLVTDAEGEIAFTQIKELVFASSAFPGAFAPQNLHYCLSSEGHATCAAGESIEALIIDGGVLDNSPLRLAVRTLGAGLRRNDAGDTTWLDSPELNAMLIPADTRMAFLSPEAADYPTYQVGQTEDLPESFLDLGVQLAAGFVAVARSKELYTLLEERPELRHSIYVPRRRVPTFSAVLAEFLGFFEQDFRIFDFELGMLEARRNMTDGVERAPHNGQPPTRKISYPEDDFARVASSLAWKQFTCLKGALDTLPGQPPPVGACNNNSRNQSILAQVALTRLYDNCARLETGGLQKTLNRHCLAAAWGAQPPALLELREPIDWHRGAEESELLYLLRLLSAYDFEYRDLGLSSQQAEDAPARVRQVLDDLSRAFADAQPGTASRAVGLGTRIAIDAMTQLPTSLVWFAILADTLEGGASWLLPLPANETWRLNSTLLVDGVGRIITSDSGKIAVGAALGPEWEPRMMSSSLVQLRGFLRGGYLLAQGDRFAFGACHDHAKEQLGSCSRAVVQAVFGATVLDNLRVQVLGAWYPPIRHGEQSLWAVSPGVGLQF